MASEKVTVTLDEQLATLTGLVLEGATLLQLTRVNRHPIPAKPGIRLGSPFERTEIKPGPVDATDMDPRIIAYQ